MTDAELIAKKIAFIETCVRELRELAQPELIDSDIREQRFVALTLQLAIQAALDCASHIASARRLGEPETNRVLFDLLARDGWIDDELAAVMQAMAGFRNVLVHGYQSIDTSILRDIVDNRLSVLLVFVSAIRDRLPEV